VLPEHPSHVIDHVLSYFSSNWWCSEWHASVTDIGLLPGQTRDGLNTNNTIERACKTFDEVFLACRVNKRIDRLVQILAGDWLVFYEHYASSTPRLSSADRDVMLDAHRLWESRAVEASNERRAQYVVLGVKPLYVLESALLESRELRGPEARTNNSCCSFHMTLDAHETQ